MTSHIALPNSGTLVPECTITTVKYKLYCCFFNTVSCLQRVQHLYQDANSDPPVDITSFISTIKPKITQVDGWRVNFDLKHKEVSEE